MGFLLLFDVTNESSFLSIRNWLTFIDNFTLSDNNLRPPILLIGNKIDLVTERTIDTIRAQQLADELGITYIETSAVTGTNVQEKSFILWNNLWKHIIQNNL
jgi:Ras-related protein Rab-27A